MILYQRFFLPTDLSKLSLSLRVTVCTGFVQLWKLKAMEIHLGIMLNLVKHLEGIVGDDVDLFDGLAQDL